MKNKRGVTLIALIITIVVLLILAGVAFNTVLGDEGILGKASEAAETSKRAEKNELDGLNNLEKEIDKWMSKTLEEKIADAGLPADTIGSLSDVVDGVPIPKSFYYVGGTRRTGIVISDKEEDYKKGDSHAVAANLVGNQFVWVPTKDLIENGTIDGINYNQKFGRRLFGMSYSLGGTTKVSNKYTENIPSDLSSSVLKYGGFYIARYQASYENFKLVSKKSKIAVETWSEPNGKLYNNVTQATAIAECSYMYNSGAKVVAHIPYGAEWDSTLQWLKQTVFNNTDMAIGEDSKGWGNYKDAIFTYGANLTKVAGTSTIINTGDTEYSKKNNIYDIAGNLQEWTQEEILDTITFTTIRSGAYNGNSAAATRIKWPATSTNSGIGFRPALYIK